MSDDESQTRILSIQKKPQLIAYQLWLKKCPEQDSPVLQKALSYFIES